MTRWADMTEEQKEKKRAALRRWRQANREVVLKKKRAYDNARYASDVEYRDRRRAVNRELQAKKRAEHDDFRKRQNAKTAAVNKARRLEKQFDAFMSSIEEQE